MSQFRKSEGGCTLVSPGCPCGPLLLATTASSIPCVLDAFWATSLTGGAGNININDVIVGSCGNVYVIGQAFGAMNVNSFVSPPSPIGAGNLINTSIYARIDANEGTSDFAFVIKYDTYGAVQWATKIDVPTTGGATGAVSGNSIAIDSNENVYVLGTASVNTSTAVIYHATPPPVIGGTITFNTYAQIPLVSTNDIAFLVKFDTNGQAQWATYLTSSTSAVSSNGGALAVDSSGNVFLTGFYQAGPITLNSYGSISGSPVTVNITTPSITLPAPLEAVSSFVAKFLPNGELDWATYSAINPQSIGTSGQVLYGGIAVDGNGDVYVTGLYVGGFTDDILFFYSYTGGLLFPYGYLPADSSTDNNLLVAKYTGSGANKGDVTWATFVAGSSSTDENGSGIVVDSNSNVYVIGNYNSIPQTLYDFVSGGTGNLIATNPTNTINTPSPTTTGTVLIVKYNSAGTVLAATNMAGTNQNIGVAIAVDGNANVYVTGYYQSSPLALYSFSALGTPITLTTPVTLPLSAVNAINTYVVKLNSSLVVQWGVRLDAGSASTFGNAIAVDPNGNVHAVGLYGADVNVYGFGASGTPITLNPYGYVANGGSANSYLIKYSTGGTLV